MPKYDDVREIVNEAVNSIKVSLCDQADLYDGKGKSNRAKHYRRISDRLEQIKSNVDSALAALESKSFDEKIKNAPESPAARVLSKQPTTESLIRQAAREVLTELRARLKAPSVQRETRPAFSIEDEAVGIDGSGMHEAMTHASACYYVRCESTDASPGIKCVLYWMGGQEPTPLYWTSKRERAMLIKPENKAEELTIAQLNMARGNLAYGRPYLVSYDRAIADEEDRVEDEPKQWDTVPDTGQLYHIVTECMVNAPGQEREYFYWKGVSSTLPMWTRYRDDSKLISHHRRLDELCAATHKVPRNYGAPYLQEREVDGEPVGICAACSMGRCDHCSASVSAARSPCSHDCVEAALSSDPARGIG